MRQNATTPSAKAKKRIQALLREIAIKRDGGCFMRHSAHIGGACSNVLQFDHLVTRAKSGSYGDPRIGVCACTRHHIFWKKQYPFEYERAAIDFIGKQRADLVYRAREDGKSHPMSSWDWAKIEIALTHELINIQPPLTNPKETSY